MMFSVAMVHSRIQTPAVLYASGEHSVTRIACSRNLLNSQPLHNPYLKNSFPQRLQLNPHPGDHLQEMLQLTHAEMKGTKSANTGVVVERIPERSKASIGPLKSKPQKASAPSLNVEPGCFRNGKPKSLLSRHGNFLRFGVWFLFVCFISNIFAKCSVFIIVVTNGFYCINFISNCNSQHNCRTWQLHHFSDGLAPFGVRSYSCLLTGKEKNNHGWISEWSSLPPK